MYIIHFKDVQILQIEKNIYTSVNKFLCNELLHIIKTDAYVPGYLLDAWGPLYMGSESVYNNRAIVFSPQNDAVSTFPDF